MKRVLIVGTGALASLFGARMARAGHARVSLAGSWRSALKHIGRSGLTVEDEQEVWSVPVACSPLEMATGPADLVLVLVKGSQTEHVAPVAARCAADDGLVVTLQNGLGNAEILAVAAGSSRVAVGVTSVGATLLGPGRVKVAGSGPTVLGARADTAPKIVQAADLLRGAGFQTTISADIDRLVWCKLAVSCAINPLSALLGVENGQLLEREDALATLDAAAREVGAVAAARGIVFERDPAGLAREVARRTSGNRSSMLQDLERGAATEIDSISGAVVREGRRLGVPTTVNEELWRRVLAAERQALREPVLEAAAVLTPEGRR